MATERKQIDWELVERHFRAGILSLRQIAEECGGTEGAIRKRAKKDCWPRDLTEKIKVRTEELVRKAEVRTPSTQLTPATEKQTIEANAEAAAIILIAQKGSIARGHSLFRALMDELEATTQNKELFAQLGELMDKSTVGEDGKAIQDKKNQIYEKIISMPQRVDSAKKAIEILEKIVKMEREAFGIDTEKQENPVDSALKALMAFRTNRA
jgi:hypothetical protein